MVTGHRRSIFAAVRWLRQPWAAHLSAMMCHARPDVVLAEIRVSFNVSVLKRVLHGPRGDRVIKTTSKTKFELLGINWLDLEPLISHVRIPCADYLAIPIDS